MLYIGVDLGTSAVKLLLMEESGTIRRVVSRKYPVLYPQPGWSEQRPEDWYRETVAGIRELVLEEERSRVAGISFGGQMHGLVVLDEQDQVLRPAILWNDGRTAKETDWLNQSVGQEKLSQYTANIAFAGFTAPKLLWMQNNEPELFAKIAKIMLPKDYLVYRFTGVHATEPSDAAGMLLFDVRNKCWSAEMLEICGVRPEQMPKIYESAQVVGTLLPEMAAALQLSETVRVAAGAGDNAAAAVGTGTVGEGACNISVGTSGTLFITSRQFSVDPKNALHSFAHADGGYHLMGCILSAASCQQWWMERIMDSDDYASAQSSVDAALLGKNHVFFAPYLMGERSPHNDTQVRGAFVGLTPETTRAEMQLAIWEGVAFAIRDCLEVARASGIVVKESKICGGGAKNALWRAIFANVLNVDISRVETEEGPGLGAAMLAAVACGAYSSVEEAAEKIVQVKDTVHPTAELVARYEERYQVYRKLYPVLHQLGQV